MAGVSGVVVVLPTGARGAPNISEKQERSTGLAEVLTMLPGTKALCITFALAG
jgi:hypothetical protein